MHILLVTGGEYQQLDEQQVKQNKHNIENPT